MLYVHQLRFKIFRNIGQAFVRLGQFQDAIQSFETVMGGTTTHVSNRKALVSASNRSRNFRIQPPRSSIAWCCLLQALRLIALCNRWP